MKKLFALFLVLLLSQSVSAYNGDVNGDGAINSADITAIYNYLLNGDSSSLVNGDVNGDGVITAADVTAVYNILLGNPNLLVFIINDVTFKMIPVDGGTFTMGVPEGQFGYQNEKPAHQVTLDSFSIGQTEVTQELWQAVMGNNPSMYNGGNYGIDLQRPVETVTWNDCQEFIAQLNVLTGKNFRLPTEAEWEFAARGGISSLGYLYSGSNIADDVSWNFDDIPSQQYNTMGYGTQTVATKLPNELGIYDMTGNVYEWCQDWYGSYSEEAQTNPTGPDSGTQRVFRGGCWTVTGDGLRVTWRGYWEPTNGYYGLGFRLAL